MSHKIVFLDRETLDANVRKPNFPHEYTEHAQTAPDQIVERLKGATICITNKVPLREATLKQLPGLKLIAVAATGTDVIDERQRDRRLQHSQLRIQYAARACVRAAVRAAAQFGELL
jgi:lactate dehydrogenase-like 2-hydroxyacid dehydrogenase